MCVQCMQALASVQEVKKFKSGFLTEVKEKNKQEIVVKELAHFSYFLES